MSKRTDPARKLIKRSVNDANFVHTLSLFPFLRMWAEGLEPGFEITFNDRNMIHIPTELLEAFIRERAEAQDASGAACRGVLAKMDEVEMLLNSPPPSDEPELFDSPSPVPAGSAL